MTKKALFVVLPVLSHYRSIHDLAKQYRMDGYDIVLSQPPSKVDNFDGWQLNETNVMIPYMTDYFPSGVRSLIRIFLLSVLDRSFNKRRQKSFDYFVENIRNTVTGYRPDIILIDAHLSIYYLFLFDICAKIKIVHTKLLSRKCAYVPPLYSRVTVTHPSILYFFYTEALWIRHALLVFLRMTVAEIAFLGNSNLAFAHRYAWKKRVRFHDIFRHPAFCSFPFIELRECVEKIILAPKGLEYPWRKYSNNEYYHVREPRSESDSMAKYPDVQAFIAEFITQKQQCKDFKLIYCAFGSMPSGERKLHRFFNILQEFVASHESYYLLLCGTAGSDKSPARGAESDIDRIFLRNHLPQRALLQHCDLFIFHGGVNSIRDCLDFSTRTLVLPRNLAYDQAGNAARLRRIGIGRHSSLSSISASKLSTIMDEIFL